MIRINLLRERAARSRGVFAPEFRIPIIFAGALLLVGLFIAGWYWSLSSTAAAQRAEVAELEQESARLRTIQTELERFEREKAELDSRLAAVERLQRNRHGPVKLMNALVASVPSTPNLWLTTLSQRGPTVTIEGNASNVPTIANFIANLSRREPFQSVELDYWEEEPSSLKFKLTCLVEN